MDGINDLPGSSDRQRSADLASTQAVRPPWGSLSSSLAVSISHGTLSVKFDIRRAGAYARDDRKRLVADETTSHTAPRGRSRIRARRAVLLRHPKRVHQTRSSPISSREVPIPMTDSDSSRTPPRRAAKSVIFWEALSPVERQTLLSRAEKRTFAGGARLMCEGEPADYVIVILSGRTRISVNDDGLERIIAQRGPGELVGERGALRVSVRSATVVALDTVQALAMKTEDFATFISAHPNVLSIVESQLYDRLTEDPIRPEHGSSYDPEDITSRTIWPAARQSGEGWPAAHPAAYPQHLNGENCTIVLSDVAGFAAPCRNDDDRRIIRKALFEMTCRGFGDIWDECSWEDRGDGLLVVAPSSIPTTRVVERLIMSLPVALKLHNRTYGMGARIQLRIAANVGPVVSDDTGMSGEAIIHTARLVEALTLKRAMAENSANLGVIVSPFVFDTVIKQRECTMEPASYHKVHVRVKEASLPAWMRLTGSMPVESPPRCDLSHSPAPVAAPGCPARGLRVPHLTGACRAGAHLM